MQKLILILTILLSGYGQKETTMFDTYITRQGDKLMEGSGEFRFLSFNIPNLLFIEDNMPFEEKNPYRLPNSFEIADALHSVKQMGGQVVRSYTITVAREDAPDGFPCHVIGPGQFNEEAFAAMDCVLALANEIGIRLVIPLVDNWKWMGGVPQYAGFRKKDMRAFWTDSRAKWSLASAGGKCFRCRYTVPSFVFRSNGRSRTELLLSCAGKKRCRYVRAVQCGRTCDLYTPVAD